MQVPSMSFLNDCSLLLIDEITTQTLLATPVQNRFNTSRHESEGSPLILQHVISAAVCQKWLPKPGECGTLRPQMDRFSVPAISFKLLLLSGFTQWRSFDLELYGVHRRKSPVQDLLGDWTAQHPYTHDSTSGKRKSLPGFSSMTNPHSNS